ncbi:MAG: hypothetical protein ACRC0L_09700, partial [Angustibacter sp.]
TGRIQKPMIYRKHLDHLRLRVKLISLDFWLDFYRLPRHTRLDIRRELTANLTESAAQTGMREAVHRLGSSRRYAQAAAFGEQSPSLPRWGAGQRAALAVIFATAFAVFFCAMGFAEGVRASGAQSPVSGDIRLLPGVRLDYAETSTLWAAGLTINPLVFVILSLLAFAVFAQPWRGVLGRNSAQPIQPK